MRMADTEALCQALRACSTQTMAFLCKSDGWRTLTLEEGVFHTGDDPIEEDDSAQKVFEQLMENYESRHGDLRIHSILGEEANRPVPTLNPNERVILLDPLDGSKTWAACRSNFCVALLALRADATGHPRLETAMITTPLHVFTFVPPNKLYLGQLGGSAQTDALVSSVTPEAAGLLFAEANTPFLAVNAYKARERKSLLAIAAALPDWHIITTAGNPVTPYVVTGGVTAALTLRSSTNWDAIGVLMAAATDAVVRQANDGAVVYGPAFAERFNQILVEGHVYAIPPMLVAKSQARSDQVFEALSKAHVFDASEEPL